MSLEDAITHFFKLFNAYIAKCKKQCQLRWDSVASEDLLKPHSRSLNFISHFESTNEFKRLIDVILAFDKEYDEDDDLTRSDYNSASCYLHNFFANTSIYDFIIAGKEFVSKEYFALFFKELIKQYDEVLEYGEVYPLALNIEYDMLEFDDFKISKDGSEYDIDTGTNYCFLVNAPKKVHTIRRSSPIPDSIPGVGRATPFSLSVLLLNLYFERPIYIREWWEKDKSPFGDYYEPKRTFINIGNIGREDLWRELEARYGDEAINEAFEDDDYGSYFNDETHFYFIMSKEKEFIKSGQAPINYLYEEETPRFKDFIIETRNFLQSDFYKSQAHLHVAIHYYLMAHERENARDDIINYVTALESLYFTSGERSKIKEQFSKRIANVISKNSDENKFIHDNMSFIYKKRCDYVHGSKLLVNPKRE